MVGALVAIGLLLFVGGIGTFAVKYRLYNVLSDSMIPVLLPGDRIVSDTAASGGDGVRRGDVVMLDPAAWPSDPESAAVVKRVVAVGGDRVSFSSEGNRLGVNGRAVREDYLPAGVPPAYEEFAVTVPARHVFVLGDNRPGSIDSRAHLDEPKSGAVPLSAVRGRLVAVAYPFDRAGELTATEAFRVFDAPRTADTPLLLTAGAVLAGAVLLLAAGVVELLARARRFVARR